MREETLHIQIQHRLIEELTKANRELKIVNDCSQSIQESQQTQDVARAITLQLRESFGFAQCVLYLKDEAGEFFKEEARSPERKEHEERLRFRVGEGFLGQATLIPQEEQLAGGPRVFLRKSGKVESGTIAIMPDKYSILGLLYFTLPQEEELPEHYFKILGRVASMTATKLQQTRNYEKIAVYQAQLEDYVHIVSHDLKSPLRSINALLSWLREDNSDVLTPSSSEGFDQIDHVLEQMENLITSTLNYSKMDSLVVPREKIDLNELVGELQKALCIPPQFSITIRSELPTVCGEKIKFMQIFQNLMQNAILYNDKDAGSLEIWHHESISHISIFVSDNGPGIAEKYFEKIFQAYQSLGAHKESSGIGLSIVKKLVEQIGGEISLESTLGQGTTFGISLPKFELR